MEGVRGEERMQSEREGAGEGINTSGSGTGRT